MSNILITILSRAGSCGCPGKHIKIMNGKHLIEWTIEQAMQWDKGLIIVSSDDEKVHHLSESMGIPWVWQRPPPTDTTAKVPAIRNALLDAERIFSREFDLIVDLDATAPLRTIADIDGCVAALGDYDCLLSATVGVGRNPYWNQLEFQILPLAARVGTINPHKKRRLLRSKHFNINTRQEAPKVYEANSSIYVYQREFLIRPDVVSPLDGNCGIYVMPDESYYHVDSELDFELVEFIMKKRLLNESI